MPFATEENLTKPGSSVSEQPSDQPKSSPTASSYLPAGILNMGEWEIPEAAGLYFGFGSYGHENEQPEATKNEEEISKPQTTEPTLGSMQQ